MRTFIEVPGSLRKEIMDKFDRSQTIVWRALNYVTDNKRAKEIRAYALEHGGAIIEKDFIPNCRTEHTQEEMIQIFPGGIQVRLAKTNGEVRLLQDDILKERFENITLRGWGNLLYQAQGLSERRISEITAQ